MKIALLGYGKMGKAVEEDALANGHEIVLKIGKSNLHELTIENLQKADVAIEFSTPATVLDNIYLCFDAAVPIVIGTTGWYDKLTLITADCDCRNTALFYASNFSIGVNIFFQVNEILAGIMNDFPEYNAEIREVHHIHKLDAPSGTAITLAEGMISVMKQKRHWKNVLAARREPDSGNAGVLKTDLTSMPVNSAADGSETATDSTADATDLIIYSEREGEVKGLHTVSYVSENDQIVFTHEAFNRKGFAQGAVLAAEWVSDKAGVYTMRDLLGFITEKN